MLKIERRAAAVICAIVILFGLSDIKIMKILSDNYAAVQNINSTLSAEIFSSRAVICDCNLRPFVNNKNKYIAAAKPTAIALAELEKYTDKNEHEIIKEKLKNGKPIICTVKSNKIFSDDITVFSVSERYDGNNLACHIIGYTDSDGKGVTGIEKSFDSFLGDNKSSASIKFKADALGRVMLGEKVTEIHTINKSAVVLTLDKRLQQICEKALDETGIIKGAAVMIEVKTGNIKAVVSRPAFDMSTPAESINDNNAPFINRAFCAYTVGSVFKPLVAAAALENGVSKDFSHTCTGNTQKSGVSFSCYGNTAHGETDMCKATAQSCNTYYINLAQQIGAKEIIETAKSFGFSQPTELADGIVSAPGILPDESEIDSAAALANLSFGQGRLMATPLQMAAMMATIANEGKYNQPRLIYGFLDKSGNLTLSDEEDERRAVITPKTAQTIMNFLKETVENGSGSLAKNDKVSCAGKTATAQTGIYENGDELCNAWFAGYFPADNPRYAVAILKENGETGSISCAPVFSLIAERTAVLENYSKKSE